MLHWITKQKRKSKQSKSAEENPEEVGGGGGGGCAPYNRAYEDAPSERGTPSDAAIWKGSSFSQPQVYMKGIRIFEFKYMKQVGNREYEYRNRIRNHDYKYVKE